MATPAVSFPDISRAADARAHGTAFGSPAAVPFTPRRRDRRQALGDLVAALTRSLDRRQDIALMRGAFEEWLRRMVPLRTVRLREAGNRWSGSGGVSPAPESIAIEVPAPDGARPGVLEATFDPACGLGEWDFQMLGIAAHIGAL